MSTEVRNLETGQRLLLPQPPHKAVVLAYRQLTEGNVNWWEDGYFDVEVSEGERTVTCGEWTALKEGFTTPNCELKYTHEEDKEATVSFLEVPATNPEDRPGEHYDYEACDGCALYLLGAMRPANNRGRRITITFHE